MKKLFTYCLNFILLLGFINLFAVNNALAQIYQSGFEAADPIVSCFLDQGVSCDNAATITPNNGTQHGRVDGLGGGGGGAHRVAFITDDQVTFTSGQYYKIEAYFRPTICLNARTLKIVKNGTATYAAMDGATGGDLISTSSINASGYTKKSGNFQASTTETVNVGFVITFGGIGGCGGGRTYIDDILIQESAQIIKNFTITQLPALTAAITSSAPISCFGGSNGTATVTPSGGTLPYALLWSPGGQTANFIINQPAGTYTVTVTDSNGCTAVDSVTLTQPATPLTFTITSAPDTGGCTGTATANPTGGTPPYNYWWDGVLGSQTKTGLCADSTYTLIVWDNNGCTDTAGVTISGPACPLTTTITGIDATCNGGSDGSATVSVSGGAPPYTYSWSPPPASGQTDSTATGLTAGTYYVTLTDTNGCTVTDSIALSEPPSIIITWVVDTATFGNNDGAINITVTFGVSPYSFLWSDLDTTEDISGITAGAYTVVVTDANGCTDSVSITVPEFPDPCLGLTLTFITSTAASCLAACDGGGVVSASGGAGTYDFLWNDPSAQTSQLALSLCAGIYLVTVTDSIGCTDTLSVTVGSQPEMTLAITPTDATCGNSDGSASVNVINGATPYTYSWSSGDTLADADSLASGIYIVIVTDANGCSNFGIATISDSGGPSIIEVVTDVTCQGGSNGAIDIFVSGGTPPYTYAWSNGSTTQNISGLVAGPYEMTIIDANGCTNNTSLTVNEPDALILTITTTDANCSNNDGSATVSVSGGTSPLIYVWETGGTDSTADSLTAGVYLVTVIDNNGCTDSVSAAVSNIGGPAITIDSIIDGGCGADLGSIYITLTGGSGDYTYLWSNSSAAQDLVGVSSGTYSVTVTDTTNGCIATESAHISGVPATDASICLVTVDSATGRNLIVWEKLQTQGVKLYKIYRESSQAGIYYLIGNVPVDSVSVFTDTLSNPLQQAYRYKISVVDSCDNESEKSLLHKTMHLTINEGLGGVINLIWDHYDGFGFLTYYIHRYSTSTGWEVIDSIASSLTSRTDFSPPPANLSYRVVVKHPTSCLPAVALAQAGDPNLSKVLIYNSARSNVSNRLTTGIDEGGTSLRSVQVFPNPYTGKTEITYTLKEAVNVSLEVYNVLGKKIQLLVNGEQKSGEYKYSFSAKGLGYSSGIYILKLRVGDSVYTKQLMEY